MTQREVRGYSYPMFAEISWIWEQEYDKKQEEIKYKLEYKPYLSEGRDWILGHLWILINYSDHSAEAREMMEYLIEKITGEVIKVDCMEGINMEVYRQFMEDKKIYYEFSNSDSTDQEVYWIYEKYKEEIEQKGWDNF